MAMFENFPYTDMHNLNLDWIIKIAKDFLDQYTHIQQLISDGETSLQNLTEEGLQQLQDKADNLESLLQEWYNTHSQDIANQLADALQDLNDWYTLHQNYLDQTLVNKINAFNTAADQKAAQTIATIPSDYTDVFNKVTTLNNILNFMNSGYRNIEGSYCATWNDIVTDENATRTDYIPVIPNTTIVTCGKINSSGYEVAFFDAQKNFISDSCIPGDGNINIRTMFVPATAFYVIVSGYNFHGVYCYPDAGYDPIVKYSRAIIKNRTNYKKCYITDSGYYYPYASSPSFSKTETQDGKFTDLIPVIPGETIKYSTQINNVGYEIVFYNYLKIPIINGLVRGDSNPTEKTITAPSNAFYVQMFAYGAAYAHNAYIMFGKKEDEIPSIGFYPLTYHDGYYHDGTLVEDQNGLHSQYIPIEKGTVIEYQLSITSLGDYLTFFNKAKEYTHKIIGGTYNKIKKTYTVTSEIDGYVIASCYAYRGSVVTYKDADTKTFFDRHYALTGGYNGFNIVRKFCVIGDSLSVGCVNYPDGTSSNRELDYSWGAFLARKCNNNVVVCGFTGATAESWLTNPMGLATLEQSSSKSQVYIIALGANEQAANIGSPETINDTTTFYGAYKAIYNAIRTQNPNAIVFMSTLPTAWGDAYVDVNDAVEWQVANVGDSNTFLLDLRNYSDYFESMPVAGNQRTHYYPLGYSLISEVFEKAIEDIMLNNVNTFSYIPKIAYT